MNILAELSLKVRHLVCRNFRRQKDVKSKSFDWYKRFKDSKRLLRR